MQHQKQKIIITNRQPLKQKQKEKTTTQYNRQPLKHKQKN
jgi:hypothetical protein